MEDSESSAGLKRKDRTKSSAWAHFGVKTTEDGSAVCLYCNRSVVARNGNKSNLFSHLRTQHPAKYELAIKAKKEAKGPLKHRHVLRFRIQSTNHLLPLENTIERVSDGRN